MGKNITVLGAGAWGTAFGQVLADAGNTVTMWAKEQQIVEGIRDHHHNAVRLPSVEKLPDNMTATGDRAEAVKNVKAANQVTFNADQRVTDLFAMPFNHHPVVEKGLREAEAQQLLQAFFVSLREKRAGRPRWKPPVPENRGK